MVFRVTGSGEFTISAIHENGTSVEPSWPSGGPTQRGPTSPTTTDPAMNGLWPTPSRKADAGTYTSTVARKASTSGSSSKPAANGVDRPSVSAIPRGVVWRLFSSE